MKKRMKTVFAVLPMLGALVLSGCAQPASDNQKGEEGIAHVDAPFAEGIDGPADDRWNGITKKAAEEEEEDKEAFQGIIRFHFHNYDRNEDTKSIYIWGPGINGTQYEWDGSDAFGAYFDLDCSVKPWRNHVKKTLSFIIKNHDSWAGQSSDTQVALGRYIKLAEDIEGGRKRAHIYAAEGNGINIDCYTTAEEALQDNFRTIKANPDWHTVSVLATARPATAIKVYKFTTDYYKLSVVQRERAKEDYAWKIFDRPEGERFTLDFGETIDPHTDYMLSTNFDDKKPNLIKERYLTKDLLYSTKRFISDYTYAGDDLGMKYYADHIEYRVWAPTTAFAQLIIYASANAAGEDSPTYAGSDSKKKVVSLYKQPGGVWAVAVAGDYKNLGYTLRLYYGGAETETVDPYVKATGANGARGAIVDFAETNPEGWNTTKRPQQKFTELTTYEVHVRDFTADDSWVSNKGNKRGTYAAFAERGTTYTDGTKTVKTGFDSILELGVNAVQLLPVFDQDNEERVVEDVDEAGQPILVPPGYNWGYNPQDYNVVEGAYSSDPYNPVTRIAEYKALIKELADENIGTIMDVVYNHVASISSSTFTKVVPGYYFYIFNDSPYDQTGCGNSFNSSRIMGKRFIIDSVKWWAEEYKIKGFRFDLMGCIECDAMRALKDELYNIDPTIVMYGEGWTGMGSPRAHYPSDTYDIYARLGDNGKGAVGGFNDCIRDGLKGNTAYGSVLPESDGVFISAATPSEDAVWNSETMFIGQNRTQVKNGLTTPANQSVNYIACHDNYTLYDQVNFLLHGKHDRGSWINDYDDSVAACLAMNAAVVFAQGMAFINGGDEFFRQKIMDVTDPDFEALKKAGDDGAEATSTKWVVRNSYKYGDAVNAFQWDRKLKYAEQFKKLAEAIAFRNANLGGYFGKYNGVVDTDYGCWTLGVGAGNPALGAWTKNSNSAINIFLGGNSDSASLPITSGNYEVLYSTDSNRGTSIDCNGGSIHISRFETLVVLGK